MEIITLPTVIIERMLRLPPSMCHNIFVYPSSDVPVSPPSAPPSSSDKVQTWLAIWEVYIRSLLLLFPHGAAGEEVNALFSIRKKFGRQACSITLPQGTPSFCRSASPFEEK